jgi:hypothetical protein
VETAFVRLLVKGARGVTRQGVGDSSEFRAELAGRSVQLSKNDAAGLAAQGVIEIRNGACRARPEARDWLRRQLSQGNEPGEQHRDIRRHPDGTVRNLAESPLARLAQSTDGSAFLEPHQVEAGERVRRLVERAQLKRRVTMSYSDTPVTGGRQGGTDISDLAYDARRRLGNCLTALPPDCAGVVLDVCGMFKGLQQVERERGWPRRSAKLVLRIGLDQLAGEFGLSPVARGEASRRNHAWLGEGARPEVFE